MSVVIFKPREGQSLGAATVVRHDFQGAEVERIEAADIDRGGCGTLVIRSGTKWGAAAIRAKVVLDAVLVERVGSKIGLRRGEAQLVARRKPQQVAPLAADRAIALDDLLDLPFDVERDTPAMTPAVIVHDPLSWSRLWYSFRLSLFH